MEYINKRLIFSLFCVCQLVFFSCEDTLEWYLGLNKQPEFFDGKDYVETLNIMGVIRPQSDFAGTGSFIRVEKTGPSNHDTNFVSDFILEDASVVVSSSALEGNVHFFYNENELDLYGGRYEPNDITILPGATYYLTCAHADYDTLYGATTVPHKPEIIKVIHDAVRSELQMNIQKDEFGAMFQAVLLSDTIYYSDYTVPADQVIVTISLLKGLPKEGIIQVYSYDENLANYFSSVTSSIINLNSYRPPFKEVSGGYGIFGSLNMLQIRLEDLEIQVVD